jgi:uncharacterized protein (DUF433 family)
MSFRSLHLAVELVPAQFEFVLTTGYPSVHWFAAKVPTSVSPGRSRDLVPRAWYYHMVEVIIKNRDILGGTPVFRGTRVPIQTLFDYLEGGETLEDFLEGFPTVSRDSAVAALEEAKHLLLARP